MKLHTIKGVAFELDFSFVGGLMDFSVEDSEGFVATGSFPVAELTAEALQLELAGLGYAISDDQATLALLGILKELPKR